MDPNGLSVLSHLRAKPVGKVRRRVRELRTATATYHGGGGGLPTLDLSHSESQRLAVDALMGEGGVQGYRERLTVEGEVDFLSEREKSYILTNQQDGHVGCDGEDGHGESQLYGGPLSLCRFSASEESADGTATQEPRLPLGSQNGVGLSESDQQSQSRVEVFLQSDNREGSMKDLVREQIRKAQTALVVVVDTFSDVELLCDILEAIAMRNVCVYLLLDRLNVQQFLDMCLDLNVNGKHFPVNRNFIVLLEGRSVTSFHQEFRRLYLSSQPVPPLFHAAMTLTPSASHTTQNNPSHSVLRSMLRRQRWVNAGDNGTKDREKAAEVEIPTATEPTHLALSKLEVEHNRVETYVMTLALCQAPAQAERPSRWNREIPQHLCKVKVGHSLSDVNVSAERRRRALQAYASTTPPSDPIGLTFSRSYKHNITGIDTQCARGPSTLRTHMNPHAVAATKGPPPDPQSYPAQQFAPSQRLQWISQLHSRQVAHNMSRVTGTLGRRIMEEPGQRDSQSGVSAMSRGRTSGVLSRPAMRHRGATLGARLKENHSM
ncbi:unnamed protein product [Lota lota]